MNPITTDNQYLPYLNDDRGPYEDNEVFIGVEEGMKACKTISLMIENTIFRDAKARG